MASITDNEARFSHERSYKRASILWGMIGFFMVALVVFGAFRAVIHDKEHQQRDVTSFAVRGDMEQLTAPRDWE